jgi:3D (Asp-Asp-Asp) domain-containing protein
VTPPTQTAQSGDPPYANAMRNTGALFVGLWCLWLSTNCRASEEQSLEVTATAYNSVANQTAGDPTLAAWGDVLKPGMKSIAVSRDLIGLGLGHKAVVRIDGLPGEYLVLDKLAKRWTKRIDIYMGEDVAAARRFGKQSLTIRWTKADD